MEWLISFAFAIVIVVALIAFLILLHYLIDRFNQWGRLAFAVTVLILLISILTAAFKDVVFGM